MIIRNCSLLDIKYFGYYLYLVIMCLICAAFVFVFYHNGTGLPIVDTTIIKTLEKPFEVSIDDA